ncbi:hypothetical protein PIB30_081924 [Stylosanthes scabra]|uniref:Uncharacterized protein n=1 Tax=Stylosanthes scabra TaxID=79078 RepID=A0ABU6UQN2_9FABA|nr:hypothetical protein [Stylosanthes scabra]
MFYRLYVVSQLLSDAEFIRANPSERSRGWGSTLFHVVASSARPALVDRAWDPSTTRVGHVGMRPSVLDAPESKFASSTPVSSLAVALRSGAHTVPKQKVSIFGHSFFVIYEHETSKCKYLGQKQLSSLRNMIVDLFFFSYGMILLGADDLFHLVAFHHFKHLELWKASGYINIRKHLEMLHVQGGKWHCLYGNNGCDKSIIQLYLIAIPI